MKVSKGIIIYIKRSKLRTYSIRCSKSMVSLVMLYEDKNLWFVIENILPIKVLLLSVIRVSPERKFYTIILLRFKKGNRTIHLFTLYSFNPLKLHTLTNILIKINLCISYCKTPYIYWLITQFSEPLRLEIWIEGYIVTMILSKVTI